VNVHDDVEKAEFKEFIKEAVDLIRGKSQQLVDQLRPENVLLEPEQVDEAMLDLAEQLYLNNLARDFLYADFKGIDAPTWHTPSPACAASLV
jgi:hypothetical protein